MRFNIPRIDLQKISDAVVGFIVKIGKVPFIWLHQQHPVVRWAFYLIIAVITTLVILKLWKLRDSWRDYRHI